MVSCSSRAARRARLSSFVGKAGGARQFQRQRLGTYDRQRVRQIQALREHVQVMPPVRADAGHVERPADLCPGLNPHALLPGPFRLFQRERERGARPARKQADGLPVLLQDGAADGQPQPHSASGRAQHPRYRSGQKPCPRPAAARARPVVLHGDQQGMPSKNTGGRRAPGAARSRPPNAGNFFFLISFSLSGAFTFCASGKIKKVQNFDALASLFEMAP